MGGDEGGVALRERPGRIGQATDAATGRVSVGAPPAASAASLAALHLSLIHI